jgi:cytochrome o ubiquinol oxidase subunit IV
MTHNTSTSQGSLLSYTIGFLLSVGLTLLAFWAAPTFGSVAAVAIVGLALVQLVVQLVFFLHLGAGLSSRLTLLLFTLVIIGILVLGTLWIMTNLERLHQHTPGLHDLYEGGTIAPGNELH